MASIFARGERLYARLKHSDGAWINESTPYRRGQEALAREYSAEAQRLHDETRAAKDGNARADRARPATPLSVSAYGLAWADRRKDQGIVSAPDDRTRLELHALPAIGSLLMVEVRPKHIREVIESLKARKTMAPRSIRHVYGTLSTMFRTAVAEEIIRATPCVLERGVLPKKLDSDPTWRATAIYTRKEIVQLLTDPRLIIDRRILYALKFFAALRHTEAATLTWGQIVDRKPLPGIVLSNTKTQVPREVPVHPTLKAILAAWKKTGWRSVYGRRPRPDDLVTPTRASTPRDASESQKQLHRDLELIGLRARRGHDLRRTMITLSRVDGARRDLLETVTHGPRGNIVDVYTTFPWPALCEEIRRLRLPIRGMKAERLAAGLAAASKNARKRWRYVASPTGFETTAWPEVKGAPEEFRAVVWAKRGEGALRSDPPAARLAASGVRAIRAGDHMRAVVLLRRVLDIEEPLAAERQRRRAV